MDGRRMLLRAALVCAWGAGWCEGYSANPWDPPLCPGDHPPGACPSGCYLSREQNACVRGDTVNTYRAVYWNQHVASDSYSGPCGIVKSSQLVEVDRCVPHPNNANRTIFMTSPCKNAEDGIRFYEFGTREECVNATIDGLRNRRPYDDAATYTVETCNVLPDGEHVSFYCYTPDYDAIGEPNCAERSIVGCQQFSSICALGFSVSAPEVWRCAVRSTPAPVVFNITVTGTATVSAPSPASITNTSSPPTPEPQTGIPDTFAPLPEEPTDVPTMYSPAPTPVPVRPTMPPETQTPITMVPPDTDTSGVKPPDSPAPAGAQGAPPCSAVDNYFTCVVSDGCTWSGSDGVCVKAGAGGDGGGGGLVCAALARTQCAFAAATCRWSPTEEKCVEGGVTSPYRKVSRITSVSPTCDEVDGRKEGEEFSLDTCIRVSINNTRSMLLLSPCRYPGGVGGVTVEYYTRDDCTGGYTREVLSTETCFHAGDYYYMYRCEAPAPGALGTCAALSRYGCSREVENGCEWRGGQEGCVEVGPKPPPPPPPAGGNGGAYVPGAGEQGSGGDGGGDPYGPAPGPRPPPPPSYDGEFMYEWQVALVCVFSVCVVLAAAAARWYDGRGGPGRVTVEDVLRQESSELLTQGSSDQGHTTSA